MQIDEIGNGQAEEPPHLANVSPVTPLADNDSVRETIPQGVLDEYSLETLIKIKISRFLSQIGEYPPENLHAVMMAKFERPLLTQVMQKTGGNQVHAARTLGINRNTLRKKIRIYNIRV